MSSIVSCPFWASDTGESSLLLLHLPPLLLSPVQPLHAADHWYQQLSLPRFWTSDCLRQGTWHSSNPWAGQGGSPDPDNCSMRGAKSTIQGQCQHLCGYQADPKIHYLHCTQPTPDFPSPHPPLLVPTLMLRQMRDNANLVTRKLPLPITIGARQLYDPVTHDPVQLIGDDECGHQGYFLRSRPGR